MRHKFKYFLSLLWFSYLLTTSVLVFSKGFLLTRDVQQINSTCKDSMCETTNRKVILLLIDALRYDFAEFKHANNDPQPFENKLPIIETIIREQPNNSRLARFEADPPTTTMQRLKALTTGSLPTFVDAGSNFATSEINEDNLIDQLVTRQKRVVFMGDDTWVNLYPNRFTREFPFPSFDVWDLDTVDNGVKSKIFHEIQQADFDLLIGHLLGVDHCGHRYGPYHPEMARKLTEINQVIQQIIDIMDNETILFVIGDHGMTSTGDHGGESWEEIMAAMFVYSKTQLQNGPLTAVKQVDIVPTLAAILGIPIPYQNLGILIDSALPMSIDSSQMFQYNLKQVWTYLKQYSLNNQLFDETYLEIYQNQFDTLTDNESIKEFLLNMRLLCEEVWIQFDAFSISNGLTFNFLTIFFLFIISDGIPIRSLPITIEGSFITACCTIVTLTAIIILTFSYHQLIEDFYYTNIFFTNILSHLMFLLPIFQNWGDISNNWYKRSKSHGIPNLICRFLIIFNISTNFSNSFINEESAVLMFCLTSVIVITMFQYKFNKRVWLLAIFILMFLRYSNTYWRCRVEQEWCHNINQKIVTKSHWINSVIAMSAFVILKKLYLKKCGNLNGYSINEMLTKLIPSCLTVITAGFWVLQRLNSPIKTTNYLALSVYALSVICMVLLIWRPVCVSIILNQYDGVVDIFKKLQNNDEDLPIICGLATVFSSTFIMFTIYFVIVVCLLLGDVFAFSLINMIVVGTFYLFITSVVRIKTTASTENLLNVPTFVVIGWALLPQYYFYATGHQPAFPNIAWDAAFVGTKGLTNNNFVLGTLIILNTFGSYLVAALLVPLLVIVPFTIHVMAPSMCGKKTELMEKGELYLYEKYRLSHAAIFSVCCKYIAAHSIKVFGSMLAATIHCRHLMVWNIFAPKFIFEAIALFVTLVAVLGSYLLYLRVHHQVDRLVHRLNKLN